jgi:hypothetical protein
MSYKKYLCIFFLLLQVNRRLLFLTHQQMLHLKENCILVGPQDMLCVLAF